MTMTNVGFDGPVTESGYALLAGFFRKPCVADAAAWKVTAVVGPDRTVRVAAGVGYGEGVHSTSSTTVDVQLAAIASGTRWDSIVARRDFTPTPGGGTSFVAVTGTATQALASGVLTNVGVTSDQPIALVQLTAGQSTPTAVVDLRAVPKPGVVYPSVLALPAGAALGATADVAGVPYVKGVTVWAKDTTQDTGILTSSTLTSATGWGNVNTAVRVRAGLCEIRLGYRRSGAAIPVATQTGSVADSLVCTMNPPYRPPSGPPIPVHAMYGGTSSGGVYIDAAGAVRFFHGSVDIPLNKNDELSAYLSFLI